MMSIPAVLAAFAVTFAPATRPQDHEATTIDGLMKALYQVISGPAGEKRNWDRMRGLFTEDAKLGATGKRQNGDVVRRTFTVEDYIKMSGPVLEERGFFESEVERKVEQFGNIAQVWSRYEARTKADDKDPFMKGFNSLQLWNDGKRWHIVTLFWQAEG